MLKDQLTVTTAILSPFQLSRKCFFCEPESSIVELHIFSLDGGLIESSGPLRR